MQLAFFHAKDIQIFFGKLLILYLEMTQMAGKGVGLCSLRYYDTMRTKIDM